MKNLKFGKIACIVAAFCLTTEVVSIAQTYNTLAAFDETNGQGSNAPLVQGSDGNFYGTTIMGGTGGDPHSICTKSCGTVFKVTPSGQITSLYSFCSQVGCRDGVRPMTPLTLATNGNFYGTTLTGATSGTIFEITPNGKLTTLHGFCSLTNCADGSGPQGSIIQGVDGNLYGTAEQGGTNGGGTIFKITLAGSFSVLYNFCSLANCADGELPMGALALAPNGDIVGTTSLGGANRLGTVFDLSLSGQLSTLYSFPSAGVIGGNIANGVILGTDGSFYGTTFAGGKNDEGAIFRLSRSGHVRAYSFCAQQICADGAEPTSALVQGTDGNFYGTTTGADTLIGNIFQITPAGVFTSLYTFCSDGATPFAGLVQGTNGNFYGVTDGGGNNSACVAGCGAIYSLSMGLGPFVQSVPSAGKVGSTIAILGNNLTDTTSVTFNGTPATFSVISSTFIKATVPSSASSGTIQVTTSSGTLNSNILFRVVR
jgi:uncharacterized repeat protein (TIGR03803 family)